jgi:hypothetical protein
VLAECIEEKEEFRHQCEVRFLIKRRVFRGAAWLRGQLELTEKKRGSAVEKLKADIKAQWGLGNRGEMGDWRL